MTPISLVNVIDDDEFSEYCHFHLSVVLSANKELREHHIPNNFAITRVDNGTDDLSHGQCCVTALIHIHAEDFCMSNTEAIQHGLHPSHKVKPQHQK